LGNSVGALTLFWFRLPSSIMSSGDSSAFVGRIPVGGFSVTVGHFGLGHTGLQHPSAEYSSPF
jgi:hypothetical protein